MVGDRYIIYVDTGGTFSDAVIVTQDGTFATGKSSTTPENLEECYFNCIEVAAQKMNKSLREVLSRAALVGYGTTLGTNMIVTGAPGSKLGFITTRGIEDRTYIWRQRTAGLSKMEAMHMIATGHPKPLIPRPLIKGVTERVNSIGQVVIPLREEEVRQAVKQLLEQRVEGIVVGFLWAFLNNAHEVRTREIIQGMAPEVMVSLSSEVYPVIREYPRFMSTIIDLHLGKALKQLLGKIEGRLGEYGYAGPLLVMQAIGGLTQSRMVKPGTTLHSGPVGGLVGVEFLKGLYGFKNAAGSDVGGTSFDICFSIGEGELYLREPVAGRYEVATPMREIITIGSGGGTIAWFEESSGRLRVGPHSAGAVPGPACYDRGGTEPTVTDADLVLNRIDPDYFLGGHMQLNREASIKAIKEKIAAPLGLDVTSAAEAICNIVDGNMEATLKTMIISKGVDPKDCVLFAYGGMGPTHCIGYAGGLGFPKIIVPLCASVFCAFGASTADVHHRYEASIFIVWTGLPYDVVTSRFHLDKLTLEHVPRRTIERFNGTFEKLEGQAYKEMQAEGFREEAVILSYELLARYGGQLWEIRCTSPVGHISSSEDVRAILGAFEDEYERQYGRLAMAPRGGIEIISVALLASAPIAEKPSLVRHKPVSADSMPALKAAREVYISGEWVRTSIYDMGRLQAGNVVKGPAIIESTDTTLVVPPLWRASVDEYMNSVLERIAVDEQ
jgi:N-methylhydantoinase A/oxoprolinase/acetone carboxylase beta subunit